MSDVFLSYSRTERDLARQFASALQAEGWSVWWDHAIPPGLSWADMIERELSEARCVVVLWSEESLKSDWVLEEASYAREQGTLIPVVVADVRLPLGFRQIHSIDLRDWDGGSSHPEFAKLREWIQRRI